MTPSGLSDSTVVIIDDDGSLGRVVALHFVRAGTQRIGIVGSDAERGSATAQAVFAAASGMWAVSASGDLSSVADAQRMIDELAASLGDADIVVDLRLESTMVSDVVRQAMVDRGEGVMIRHGVPVGEHIERGVRTCAITVDAARAPEELATAIVEAAMAARTSLD